MTTGHILFIPGMLIIGFMFGFVFGARAARDQANLEKKRAEEREAARAARAAKRATASTGDDAKK
jgi:hypothetical protein